MSKIILITNQKGGVGKTTLTYNLANNLKSNARVAIIDLDLQGSLTKLKNKIPIDIFSESVLKDINKMDYDLIFIDTPGILLEKLNVLSKVANLIIVPTKPGIFDIMAINETLDVIEKNKQLHKVLVVLNMVKAQSTITEDIEKNLSGFKVKVAKNKISDLVAFTRSALTDGIQEHKAQKQLDDLTKEILTSIL